MVLPFTELNIQWAKQKYQFQEPTLRTKIFDLDYDAESKSEQIDYQKFNQETKGIIFQGMLRNQCVMLTFPFQLSHSLPIKMLYATIKKDSMLSKNVILLSYKSLDSLQRFLHDYYQGNHQNVNFGSIRAALNLNHKVRSKENITVQKEQLKAFLEIYGKNGLHGDVDHFQSLKQLLERLHIEWSPCEQIYQNHYLKQIKKNVHQLNQYVGGMRSKLSTLLDHILCQAYKSTVFQYSQGHQVLMENGFQSGSIVFLTSTKKSIDQTSSAQKISKLAYSFLKEYSLQQDHLHSSSTFYYPLNANYFLSMKGIILGGVIFMIVGVINLIGFLVQKSDHMKSVFSLLNLIEILVMWTEIKFTGDITFTTIYLGIKLTIKGLVGLKTLLLRQQAPKQQFNVEYWTLTIFQFLATFYFSIFNFPLFYLGAILSICMLLFKKRKILILFISIAVVVVVSTSQFDTINFQQVLTRLNMPEIENLVSQNLKLLQSVSLEIKLLLLPFLYGMSTFLLS